MFGSRTIRTLTSLLAAMTIGALALMVLQTAPIKPAVQGLAAFAPPPDTATSLVLATDIPVQPITWRNIVIHSNVGERFDVSSNCHFVVDVDSAGRGRIQPTTLWKSQSLGRHVMVSSRDWNADSVGICLVGDFSRQPPSRAQMQSLLALVRSLQQICVISADHVYLNSDLDANSRSPGEAFPVRQFTANLLRTAK
jgi:hypothetical protein